MFTFAFGFPAGPELLVIAVIALLLFGKRLPSVARSLGSSIVEFKSGLREATSGVDAVKQGLLEQTSEVVGKETLSALKDDAVQIGRALDGIKHNQKS